MHHHSRLTIVTFVVAASFSTLAHAEQSAAFTQCLELLNRNQVAQAEAPCKQAASDSGVDGKVAYGDFLFAKGDPSAASKVYDSVLTYADRAKLTPSELNALRHRALLGFYTGGVVADIDARDVLKVDPDDVEILRAGAELAKKPEVRLDYSEKLVAMDSNSFEYRILHAYALMGVNEGDKALAAADAALKLDPASPMAMTARGFAYTTKGDLAKSEKEFAAVTRKAPNEPDAWVNHATVLMKLKRFDDAIESATKALAVSPNYPAALIERARSYLFLGNPEAALADLANNKSLQDGFTVAGMKNTAETMIKTRNAITPESVAAMERDRSILLSGYASWMNDTCGFFTVPSSPQEEPDNEGLNSYRACVRNWANSDNESETRNAVGHEALMAAQRIGETGKWVDEAERLSCAKMVKKAKCIDDALHARAKAALEVFDGPKVIVGEARFAELSRDIASYNSSVKINNAANKTAGFLQAVADALAEQ